MATIKKKINIFQNKVQKIKQEIFVTQSTEQSTNQNKESPIFKWQTKIKNEAKLKTCKKKELAEIKMNLPNQNAINLTNIELSQYQQSIKEMSIFYTNTKRRELV